MGSPTEELAKAGVETDAPETLFDLFAVDDDEAEHGKWFSFGKNIRIKIRRHKSEKSIKVREKLDAPYAQASRKLSDLPKKIQDEITYRHLAEGIIADWEGVYGVDGKEVPYSADAAYKFLSHPKLREFRDKIADLSVDLSNFISKKEEAEEGN
jgi:hypothetical protein